jgi:hypothetical protein
MNQLSPTSSVETLVDGYGWYAVTRLDGNPALAAVAAEARSMNSDLDQSHVNFRSVARATMSSASARDTRKYQLDAALRNARTAVLSWVHNRQSSRYYRAIFPGGLSGAICVTAEEELQTARNILTKMTEYAVPELGPATEALRAAIEALEAALADHAVSLRARKDAWSVIQAAKVTFCRRYYGLYCQVVQIVGDPALAMTYFRHERRSASAPPEVPAPSAASPAVPQAVTNTVVEPAQAA